MKTTATLTISPQGQITIPKEWRKLLGGTKLVAWLKVATGEKQQLVLEKKSSNWVKEYAGSGKGLWGPDPDEYLRQERASWDKKYDK